MIKLSILIATIPSRKSEFAQLISVLQPQQNSEVELLLDGCMDYNIGVKRNRLLQQAKGEYIVFIDDDDQISDKYVSSILNACNTGDDCIGINGTITTNGRNERRWFISKEYGHWYTGDDGTYYRTPNHISPVKRKLALQAGFPEIAFGEDAEYSRRLLPLLKTETIISEPIYKYLYISNK